MDSIADIVGPLSREEESQLRLNWEIPSYRSLLEGAAALYRGRGLPARLFALRRIATSPPRCLDEKVEAGEYEGETFLDLWTWDIIMRMLDRSDVPSIVDLALLAVRAGADPNQTTWGASCSEPVSLLAVAAVHGRADAVEELYRSGARVCNAALSLAIKAQENGMVVLLLGMGASPNVPLGVPLAKALKGKDYELVNMLLLFGAHPNHVAPRKLAKISPDHLRRFLEGSSYCHSYSGYTAPARSEYYGQPLDHDLCADQPSESLFSILQRKARSKPSAKRLQRLQVATLHSCGRAKRGATDAGLPT